MKPTSLLLAFAVSAIFTSCVEYKAGKPPPTPPKINAFSADKTQITSGEMVKLSYQVSNATEVVLLDQAGVEVVTTGSLTEGQATVTPAASSFYVLRVRGDGGRDSAFVQVAVDQPLARVFLFAVPQEVEAGGEVDLIYSASGAATLTDTAGQMFALPSGSGVLTVIPPRSTRYTLKSSVASMVTSQVDVKVLPVLVSFSAAPPAAKAGEKITLSWTTRGADSIELTETTFGTLFQNMTAAQVAQHDFEWTVPTNLPGPSDGGTGTPILEGHPLKFVLTAKSLDPAVTLTQSINSLAGDGPRIDFFNAPAAVTQGQKLTLSWRTTNAVKLQVFANGDLIHEPPASALAEVAAGSRTVVSPGTATRYELVATAFNGLTARALRDVAVVKKPTVLTFTLPPSVATAGSSATAMWTTADAAEVQIRVKGGATVFSSQLPTVVAGGMALVYPAVTTTYELVALNAAGEIAIAEKRIIVATPIQVSAMPNPTLPGADVTVSWNAGPTIAEVTGVPEPAAAVITGSTEFFDLEPASAGATVLAFGDSNDGVAIIPATTGFRFPFVGRMRDTFWVSTNGFVSFGETGALPANADLTMPSGSPPLLAPFWDDLELGTGAVSWKIDGTAFPRRLTIQWTNVRIAADPMSTLTFQAQLLENGQFRFVYGTLTDLNMRAEGQSATVGFNVAAGELFGQHSYQTGVLAKNLELLFFTLGTQMGSFVVKSFETRSYALFFKTGTGNWLTASVPVSVFAPESISVSEAMPVPDPAFPNGAWVELVNRQSVDVSLSGLVLSASGSTTGHTFDETAIVPARGFLVVGQSTNAAENGDAGVTVVVSDVPLAAADTVSLKLGAAAVSSLTWATATAGSSVQVGEKAIDTTGAGIVCTSTKTFNANGNVGTPGQPNEVCFDYLLQSIPGDFEDLSTAGTPVLDTASDYTGFGAVALPSPFTYFGQPYTSVNLAIPGFLTFGPALTAAYDVTNDIKPSTTAPNGVVAPFWDRIVRNTSGKMLMIRRADRTVLSWQDFRIYASTGSSMNFQVKLFDTGTIEFHYGAMAAGNKIPETSGSSATTWIEKPDGTAALPANINMANGIAPNSGFRFVPRVAP